MTTESFTVDAQGKNLLYLIHEDTSFNELYLVPNDQWDKVKKYVLKLISNTAKAAESEWKDKKALARMSKYKKKIFDLITDWEKVNFTDQGLITNSLGNILMCCTWM